MRCADVHGFNYDGSWGTSGLDLWQHHDHGTMAVEIARGKRYFPKWNLARWWLSHEAFQRDPERFLANFEAGLTLFAQHDILVMPLLFNRWRDPVCDFGGVPLDHIIPGASVFAGSATDLFAYVEHPSRGPELVEGLFRAYLDAVVGTHVHDPRIFAWDLCNEPLMGPYVEDPTSPLREGELRWLTWCYQVSKHLGATQPLTIGNYPSLTALELTEPISDLLSTHPYYMWNRPEDTPERRASFEASLDAYLDVANRTGKELLASETVWGAIDDEKHIEILRFTLGALKQRDIGFTVHALHHSLVADLHYPEYGPVGISECLHFINADGKLRQGHDVFNEFC
jgi:hypothetical protein